MDRNASSSRQRIARALQSGTMSDVTFVVTHDGLETRIEAHKLFLAMASPTFELMFRDDPGLGTIMIADVKPIAVRLLLEYVYLNTLRTMRWDEACDVHRLAMRYQIDLGRTCVDTVRRSLAVTNALRIYEFAVECNEQALAELAMRRALKRTRMTALVHASFAGLKTSTVAAVFRSRYLVVRSELAIVGALVAHMDHNPRLDAGDYREAVRHVRVLSLSAVQIAECADLKRIYTVETLFAVLAYKVSPYIGDDDLPEYVNRSTRARSLATEIRTMVSSAMRFYVGIFEDLVQSPRPRRTPIST